MSGIHIWCFSDTIQKGFSCMKKLDIKTNGNTKNLQRHEIQPLYRNESDGNTAI